MAGNWVSVVEDSPRPMKSEIDSPTGRISMTRYEQDQLCVCFHGELGLVAYTGPNNRGRAVAISENELENPEELVVFEGRVDLIEVPRRELIPREVAIAAAEEFFLTGQIPKCVNWRHSLETPPPTPGDEPVPF